MSYLNNGTANVFKTNSTLNVKFLVNFSIISTGFFSLKMSSFAIGLLTEK